MPADDARLIDRIGASVVMEHFACSDRTIRHWKRAGIPPFHRNTFNLLARLHGVDA